MSRVTRPPTDGAFLEDGAVLGGWWRRLDDGRILCELCPRACHLKEGDRGFCFVRENRDGQMVLSTYGRSTGFCIDPIEKKPLNHFYPGTSVLSFGTAGCNLGCKFCQNWDISKSREIERLSARAMPEAIVAAARERGCRSIAFTYNDPVIWAEYAVDCARLCRAEGIQAVAVTAGYVMPDAREYLFSAMDAANIDLKGFTEDFYYHYTLSHLQPVLETIAWLKKETDVWFELTNLIIPQANDALEEIARMCDWILEHVGDQVPLHFTAFHPDFRLRDRSSTPKETLLAAYDVARARGLKYVYVGNVNDVAHQSTYCPECQALLIERNWYELGTYRLKQNRCEVCNAEIAGRFDERPGTWGARREPVHIREPLVTLQTPAARVATRPSAAGHPKNEPSTAKGTALIERGNPAESAREKRTSSTLGQLDATQQQRVHVAACHGLADGVSGARESGSLVALGELAERLVEGAFVTLKRRGHLRACCGVLGRLMPLGEALQQAAVRTACHDTRLPPLGADELQYCSVDVTLLHSFQSVSAAGRDRAACVEIGRHGLRVEHRERAGLLLPSVAVEYGWTTEQFLGQVCRKAGLPAQSWLSDEVQLTTFEGASIQGTFRTEVLDGRKFARPLAFTPAEIAQLTEHCRRNVIAHYRGATPSYYLPGAPDGTVHGVAITCHVAGLAEPLHASQLSFRPGLPLQATLLNLTQNVSQWAVERQLPGSAIESARVSLLLLTDVAMQGTLADPDLRGFDPGRRALVAVQPEKTVWLHRPEQSVDELMNEAVRAMGGQQLAATPLYSLLAFSSQPELVLATGIRPQRGPDVRPARLAGTFYPAAEEELGRLVDQLLRDERHPPTDAETEIPWRAAMVPHAGLKYSGHIAASVLKRLRFPETIVVVGPKHTRLGTSWAVAPHKTWAFPGGELDNDVELAERLAQAIPGLELDAAAHQNEHAIEVELPLIHRLAPQSRVVGIVIGRGSAEDCRTFAAGMADVLRALPQPPLLLISSDMHHFASDEENRRLDRIALDAMARLDPDLLLEIVTRHGITMCGVLPAVIVMHTLRALGGLDTFREIAYGTSADVTGDPTRVVGYAGVTLK